MSATSSKIQATNDRVQTRAGQEAFEASGKIRGIKDLVSRLASRCPEDGFRTRLLDLGRACNDVFLAFVNGLNLPKKEKVLALDAVFGMGQAHAEEVLAHHERKSGNVFGAVDIREEINELHQQLNRIKADLAKHDPAVYGTPAAKDGAGLFVDENDAKTLDFLHIRQDVPDAFKILRDEMDRLHGKYRKSHEADRGDADLYAFCARRAGELRALVTDYLVAIPPVAKDFVRPVNEFEEEGFVKTGRLDPKRILQVIDPRGEDRGDVEAALNNAAVMGDAAGNGHAADFLARRLGNEAMEVKKELEAMRRTAGFATGTVPFDIRAVTLAHEQPRAKVEAGQEFIPLEEGVEAPSARRVSAA